MPRLERLESREEVRLALGALPEYKAKLVMDYVDRLERANALLRQENTELAEELVRGE